MPGISAVNEAVSISLVTSSHRDETDYHLMELTPNMVHYFEAKEAEATRGVKRGREAEEAEAEENGEGGGSV